jgi:hypothetical protein
MIRCVTLRRTYAQMSVQLPTTCTPHTAAWLARETGRGACVRHTFEINLSVCAFFDTVLVCSNAFNEFRAALRSSPSIFERARSFTMVL